jgi:hypothetical protein
MRSLIATSEFLRETLDRSACGFPKKATIKNTINSSCSRTPVDNREFRDMLKKMRTSVNGIQIKDFTNSVNRKIRDVVRKDLSSHDLRGLYAVLKFQTDNPDNLTMIGHINKSLNHGETSIDSSVSYSNFQYEPN